MTTWVIAVKQMKVTMIVYINDEYESDAIDSEGEDDSNDVILAFIAADEEDSDERPVTTRLGRAITRRSEIDFSFF